MSASGGGCDDRHPPEGAVVRIRGRPGEVDPRGIRPGYRLRRHHPMRCRRLRCQRGFLCGLLLHRLDEARGLRQVSPPAPLGRSAHPRGHLELFGQYGGDAAYARGGQGPRMHDRQRHVGWSSDGALRGERGASDPAAEGDAAQTRCRLHDRVHVGRHPLRRRPRPVRKDPRFHPVPEEVQG